MSTEEGTAVVRRFLDEVISKGNMAALDETCAPDLVWHGGSVGKFRSLEEFKQGVSPFFSAFPDLRVTADDVLSEGDKACAATPGTVLTEVISSASRPRVGE